MTASNGQHIIYVNSQVQNETALGKLMHDFYCTSAENMNYGELAKKVNYFKEDERGVKYMCRAMETLCQEAAAEAAVRSAVETYRECGLALSDIVKKIMNRFHLSEDEAKNKVKEFWSVQ